MNELYVRVSGPPAGARINLPVYVRRWLDSAFVRITKTSEKIFIIACTVSDHGSLKITRCNSDSAVCIGNYVATGVFPAKLLGKNSAVYKCIYQGHHAIYLNIR